MRESEAWRPIPGYEGIYEVSSLGRVRSIDRVDCAGKRQKGRIRKLGALESGYLKVDLSKGGVLSSHTVHSLVALAHIGPRPIGMWVAHNDGVRTNCAASNLRYATPSDNHADKLRHGTSNRGKPRPDLAERNRLQAKSRARQAA